MKNTRPLQLATLSPTRGPIEVIQRIALEIALETVPLSWNHVGIQLVERAFDLDSARHRYTAWSPSADAFSNAQIGLGIEMFGPAAFAWEGRKRWYALHRAQSGQAVVLCDLLWTTCWEGRLAAGEPGRGVSSGVDAINRRSTRRGRT